MNEAKKPVNEKSYILEQQSPGSDDPISTADTEQLFKNEKDSRTTGLEFASFNYVNSIIGSGVIGIPYAFQQAGFGLGIILLALVAVITDYSLILMVRSAHLSGSYSYQGLMQAAFGSAGFIILSALQFIYPFIAMVSYNIVVGDTVTKVLIRVFSLYPHSLLARRDIVVALATIFITIPLCLLKDLARLTKASVISMIFVFFILFAIILRFFTLSSVVPASYDAWEFANWGVIPALGIMAFAFMCHHNVFLLYESIERADQTKWDKITHFSLTVSFIVSAMFGITGYATFTGFSQGDLLENYCWDDDLMNLARLFFSCTILCTYPIECLVTRSVIYQIIGEENVSDTKHVLITLAIVGTTYFLSVMTDCLGIVLELNGVLSAVPLAFILPAASYLKLEPGSVFSEKKLPALGLVAFGGLVALIGAILIAWEWHSADSCSHGRIMPYCIHNVTDIN